LRPLDVDRPICILRATTQRIDTGATIAIADPAAGTCDPRGLARENLRLQAELQAKVEELRASRSRLVEVGARERRRLERDLHDGAQQRLVALALSLRMARERLEGDGGEAGQMLDSAGAELERALGELRELARGIHPAVLSDRGLGPAIELLAGRAPFPVDVGPSPDGRLPERVEQTAYFVVSEALANAAKHASATHAEVTVTRAAGQLTIEIDDDGVGGVDFDRGSGLHGLADRVAAIDGLLEVDSAPGSGTRVRARIPVHVERGAPISTSSRQRR
jgi:signal transduction histidine kinase